MYKQFTAAAFTFALVIMLSVVSYAQPQPLSLPDISQEASVTQKIGITDITIHYHRPAVNGRVVWGKLVPYNQVWRAGANENTTISFSGPVKIAGKDIPAGSYGLHMIPSENEWTIIINKFDKGWGSFSYNESEDLLRFKAAPAAADNAEYLTYMFELPEPAKVKAVMHWEKLKVPFEIEVDVHQAVVNYIKENLRGLNQFFWQPYEQAALYCVTNNTHLEDASAWIDKSIQMNKKFSNLSVKARLLELKGDTKQSEDLLKEAFTMGTEAEINTFGYVLLQSKNTDRAIEVFKANTEKFPASWNVWDSLAEGYLNKGDKKLAKEYYTKAMNMVKDDNQKKRINDTLKLMAAE